MHYLEKCQLQVLSWRSRKSLGGKREGAENHRGDGSAQQAEETALSCRREQKARVLILNFFVEPCCTLGVHFVCIVTFLHAYTSNFMRR